LAYQFFHKVLTKANNNFIHNDILTKAIAKKLINIAPKELENKFNAAKKSICKNIFDELKTKQLDIESKINELKKYVGEEGIVPSQFKGELINPIEERAFSPEALRAEDVKTKSKVKYDM